MFVYSAIVLEEPAFLSFVSEFVKYLKAIKVLVMHLNVRRCGD